MFTKGYLRLTFFKVWRYCHVIFFGVIRYAWEKGVFSKEATTNEGQEREIDQHSGRMPVINEEEGNPPPTRWIYQAALEEEL